jgi:hypothetical protein
MPIRSGNRRALQSLLESNSALSDVAVHLEIRAAFRPAKQRRRERFRICRRHISDMFVVFGRSLPRDSRALVFVLTLCRFGTMLGMQRST